MAYFTDITPSIIKSMVALDIIKIPVMPKMKLLETPNNVDEHGEMILEVMFLENGYVFSRKEEYEAVFAGETRSWHSDGME